MTFLIDSYKFAGAGGAFTPLDLDGLLQYAIDGSDYEATQYANDSRYYLEDLRTDLGTLRAPLQGYVLNFDGTDDYGTFDSSITLSGDWAVSFFAELNALARQFIVSTGGGTQYIDFDPSGTDLISFYGTASVRYTLALDSTLTTGVEYHVCLRVVSGTAEVFVDGVKQASSSSVSGNLEIANVGSTSSNPINCRLRELRVYNGVTLSDANVATIATNTTLGTETHRWIGLETSGLTTYDSDGGNDVTWTNITESTFHLADPTIVNPANSEGYTDSSGVIIPAVDDTTDALGNTLQYQGNAPFPIRADTPCITGDGTAVYADLGSALIPATADFSIEVYYYHVANSAAARYLLSQRDTGDNIIGLLANFNGTSFTGGVLCFYVDDNTTPSLTTVSNLEAGNWHKITASRVSNLFTLTCTPIGSAPATGTFTRSITLHTANNSILLRNGPISVLYNDGRLADLQITTGGVTTTFPLQEGEGRDLGWWATDGTKGVLSGAIVGGTLANIWANLCPGLVKDHSILYGGGIDGVTGAFVPGDPNSANDVAGNPKTLSAGKFGNPHSRLQFNPFTVQEITAIGGESDYTAGDARQSVATTDTKFRRTASTGDDRFFATEEALTGTDKTNAESYVS